MSRRKAANGGAGLTLTDPGMSRRKAANEGAGAYARALAAYFYHIALKIKTENNKVIYLDRLFSLVHQARE